MEYFDTVACIAVQFILESLEVVYRTVMMKLKRQSYVWYCKLAATHTAQDTSVYVMGGTEGSTTTSFFLAVLRSGGFLAGNQIRSTSPLP